MKFFYRKHIDELKLSKEELNFLNSTSLKSNPNSNELILIQCPRTDYFLEAFKEIIKKNSQYQFIGVFPNVLNISIFERLLIIPFISKIVFHWALKNKWKKIYKKLGISIFYDTNSLKITHRILNFFKSCYIYVGLKSKKDVISLKIKDIKCGDLIYDSFLRFHKVPTLELKNLNLIFYINDALNHITYYETLAEKNHIIKYYSSYSTYIAHGIACRVLLKKNINVYTLRNMVGDKLNIKKLTIHDSSHVKPHWEYKQVFSKQSNRKKLIEDGYQGLANRMTGKSNLKYMKTNQYHKNYDSLELNEQIDGVAFIGDFFDSQHVYRSMIFYDQYEWLIFTIELSLKHNLRIGFKPHPNQRLGSKILIEKIKKKYPNVIWIDEKISNVKIFQSGIKFGISVYGTVLSELAFFDIKPVCCGDNPASGYEFIFQANSLESYKKMILNHHKLEFNNQKRSQLGEYYYMNYLHDFEYYKHV